MVSGLFIIFAAVNFMSNYLMKDKMKKFYVQFAAAMCSVMTLGSCAQEVFNEEKMAESDARMTVMTRGVDDLAIARPLRVYVFNDQNSCVAMQTLDAEASSFTATLPEGTYDVYAIGGANESLLNLPSQDDASSSSTITLKDGQQLADLMTAHDEVTLTDGGTNSTTLNLTRKVMFIKSIVINDVPTGTEAVSVTISPLRTSMQIDGTYQGTDGSFTAVLTCQSDGTTWQMEGDGHYLFPSVDNPTITVTIGSTPYAHTCSSPFEANHQITISGTYNEPATGPANVTLTGTINGVAWDVDTDVTFDFGPEEANSNPSTPSVEVPAQGSTYLGCYVLSVSGNQVTLLSPSQEKSIIDDNDDQATIASKINTRLGSWEQSISSNWRLMSYDEAEAIRSSLSTINAQLSTKIMTTTYFYSNGTDICSSNLNGGSIATNTGGRSSTYLRPVTTITIQ